MGNHSEPSGKHPGAVSFVSARGRIVLDMVFFRDRRQTIRGISTRKFMCLRWHRAKATRFPVVEGRLPSSVAPRPNPRETITLMTDAESAWSTRVFEGHSQEGKRFLLSQR